MEQKNLSENRGSFSSSIGFILASAGAAIGLGNLWKFPYVVGSSGGGLFIIFYIIFAIAFGVPIILTEMAIGRRTQVGASAAYRKIDERWSFVGIMGVLSSFVLLCYYSVVGGWVIKYIISYIVNPDIGTNSSEYFNNFASSAVEPSIYTVIFTIVCAFIVLMGVSGGIEKASEIMLPGLFLFMIILAIRALTLPNAIKGLEFLFTPDFSVLDSFEHISKTVVAAMSQVFFSLSLGMGITVTYGSYLNKKENIQKSSWLIVILDTVIAILSGVVILPSVFSFGLEPSAGAGLIFQTLPVVFKSIAFGNIFGLIFFILVFFAAVTSAIASLEVTSALLIDSFGVKRHSAVAIMSSLIIIISIFVSLSNGIFSGFKMFGMNLFDLLSFTTDKILMPLVSILTCIFSGYVLGIDNVIDEIETGANKFRFSKGFSIIMKYIAPVMISIIFVMGIVTK